MAVNAPILPSVDRDDETARYGRWAARLRVAAAVVAVLAAAIGLRTQLHDRHLAVQIEDAEQPAHVNIPPLFGDPTPAALLPVAKSGGQARSVCEEEVRPLPTRGAWTCRSWVPVGTDEMGARATDTGGPCTHRVVSQAGGAWNCWTRIAIPSLALHMPYAVPLMFGHLFAAPGETKPQVCREESRTSATHGAWTCVGAQNEPAGWRIAEPVDPGGPCSYRVADEMTGVWSCQSADAQDAGAP